MFSLTYESHAATQKDVVVVPSVAARGRGSGQAKGRKNSRLKDSWIRGDIPEWQRERLV